MTRVVPERWLATAFAATAAGALLFFVLMSVGLATSAVGETDATEEEERLAGLRAELDDAVAARDLTKQELEKAESAGKQAARLAEAAEEGAREAEARLRSAEEAGSELASCAAGLEKDLADERARADELARRLEAVVAELGDERARALSAAAAEEETGGAPEALFSAPAGATFAGPNNGLRERRFGMRAGYVDFEWADDKGVGGTALVGMYFASPRNGSVGYELGLDYARPAADDGSYESSILTGRLDLLRPVLGNGGSAARAYVLCGIAGSAELAYEITQQYTNYAGALNLGAGLDVRDGRLDVRLTYSLPFGDEDSAGSALVSAAVNF